MPEHFRDKFPFAMATRPEVALRVGEEAVQVLPELAWNMAQASRQVPARVLGGAADLMINPWQHAWALGSALPQGSCQMLPGLGHMLQNHAVDQVVEAVRSLVDAEAQRGPG
jgi:hypothetical protein